MNGTREQTNHQKDARDVTVESGRPKTARNERKEKHLTQERLKEMLSYDPETGSFVWNRTRGRGAKAGDVAGTVRANDGYIEIKLEQKKYMAHRLVWFLFNGYFPYAIDHIDRDRKNNRIENLRETDEVTNGFNRKAIKNNITGFKGVSWHSIGKRWRARISIFGKEKSLGLYDTPEEAALVYDLAAAKYHLDFSCLNFDELDYL